MKRNKPLAVITEASGFVGHELAKCCARDGYDVIVTANDSQITLVAQDCEDIGARATPVCADVATPHGLDQLRRTIAGRKVNALVANVGQRLGGRFVNCAFDDIVRVLNGNIVGIVVLMQAIVKDMRSAGGGRILITASSAGYIPLTYRAVFDASDAFVSTFANSLRAELRQDGIMVVCVSSAASSTEHPTGTIMPDTANFWIDLEDPVEVAERAFALMVAGDNRT